MVLNKASVTQARHGDPAVWPGRLGGAPRLVPRRGEGHSGGFAAWLDAAADAADTAGPPHYN